MDGFEAGDVVGDALDNGSMDEGLLNVAEMVEMLDESHVETGVGVAEDGVAKGVRDEEDVAVEDVAICEVVVQELSEEETAALKNDRWDVVEDSEVAV